jgi:hypothetical protein
MKRKMGNEKCKDEEKLTRKTKKGRGKMKQEKRK